MSESIWAVSLILVRDFGYTFWYYDAELLLRSRFAFHRIAHIVLIRVLNVFDQSTEPPQIRPQRWDKDKTKMNNIDQNVERILSEYFHCHRIYVTAQQPSKFRRFSTFRRLLRNLLDPPSIFPNHFGPHHPPRNAEGQLNDNNIQYN